MVEQGHGSRKLHSMCPRDGRDRTADRRCGGSASFYCAKWGCETTGEAYWNPTSRWDLIRVKKNASRDSCDHYGWCNPLAITFTDKGKSNRDWVKEKAWGLRFYQQGYDQGLIIRIRLKIEATSTTQVGPNRVLAEQGPPAEVSPFTKSNCTPDCSKKIINNCGQRSLCFHSLHTSERPTLVKLGTGGLQCT